MDKNNSSQTQQDIDEGLLYLPPDYLARAKNRQIVHERGVLKTFGQQVWARFKENPFPFIGLSVMVIALGRSFFTGMRSDFDRSTTLMYYSSLGGVFTVMSVWGGWQYQDYKARKLQEQMEKHDSDESS